MCTSGDTELGPIEEQEHIQSVAHGHVYTVHLKNGVGENLPQSPASLNTPPPFLPSPTEHDTI